MRILSVSVNQLRIWRILGFCLSTLKSYASQEDLSVSVNQLQRWKVVCFTGGFCLSVSTSCYSSLDDFGILSVNDKLLFFTVGLCLSVSASCYYSLLENFVILSVSIDQLLLFFPGEFCDFVRQCRPWSRCDSACWLWQVERKWQKTWVRDSNCCRKSAFWKPVSWSVHLCPVLVLRKSGGCVLIAVCSKTGWTCRTIHPLSNIQ